MRTFHMVKMAPSPAGMNHTMFMMGTSSGALTSRGVMPWPKTIPIGEDIPSREVAKVL